jgi:hypothetical protein
VLLRVLLGTYPVCDEESSCYPSRGRGGDVNRPGYSGFAHLCENVFDDVNTFSHNITNVCQEGSFTGVLTDVSSSTSSGAGVQTPRRLRLCDRITSVSSVRFGNVSRNFRTPKICRVFGVATRPGVRNIYPLMILPVVSDVEDHTLRVHELCLATIVDDQQLSPVIRQAENEDRPFVLDLPGPRRTERCHFLMGGVATPLSVGVGGPDFLSGCGCGFCCFCNGSPIVYRMSINHTGAVNPMGYQIPLGGLLYDSPVSKGRKARHLPK